MSSPPGPALPARVPAAPWAAPPSMFDAVAYRQAADRRRGRSGATMLAVGAVFHFLAIPAGLFFLKVFVELRIGRSVGWDELFNALAVTGGMTILIIGIVGQIVLGVLAVSGAVLVRGKPSGSAYGMIALGVVGMVFSIVYFGGFVGLIGGLLVTAGGATARPKETPPFYSPTPPPYRPPSPPPPPNAP